MIHSSSSVFSLKKRTHPSAHAPADMMLGGKADAAGDDKMSSAAAEKHFSPLMVVTACVVAFAHGSNDVSNAIGPFSAIVEMHTFQRLSAESSEVPVWILVCGGAGMTPLDEIAVFLQRRAATLLLFLPQDPPIPGIVVGLGTYGYKCMATVGSNITKLTYSRLVCCGF